MNALPGFAPGSRVDAVHGVERCEPTVAVTPHGKHGMNHQMNREPGPGQHHAKRIHEEGHVIEGDFDDRVRRAPAVAGLLGVVHAHERAARLAHCGEAQVSKRSSGKIFARVFRQIFLGDAAVILTNEVFCLQRIAATSGLPRGRGDAFDQLLTRGGNGDGHDLMK